MRLWKLLGVAAVTVAALCNSTGDAHAQTSLQQYCSSLGNTCEILDVEFGGGETLKLSGDDQLGTLGAIKYCSDSQFEIAFVGFFIQDGPNATTPPGNGAHGFFMISGDKFYSTGIGRSSGDPLNNSQLCSRLN